MQCLISHSSLATLQNINSSPFASHSFHIWRIILHYLSQFWTDAFLIPLTSPFPFPEEPFSLWYAATPPSFFTTHSCFGNAAHVLGCWSIFNFLFHLQHSWLSMLYNLSRTNGTSNKVSSGILLFTRCYHLMHGKLLSLRVPFFVIDYIYFQRWSAFS